MGDNRLHPFMDSRYRVLVATLLLALFPVGLYSETVSQMVIASSRSSNDLVLRILLEGDMTDAVAAAQALGKRKDPYIGDILERLSARATGAQAYRFLLLLRVILERVFLLPSPFPAKIAANSKALESLVSSLQSIPDAATKGALLHISGYLPVAAVEKPLLDEGNFLIAYLRGSSGRFTPDRLDEALSFIGACEAHDNSVLRNQVIVQVELARSAAFVRAARSYLARRP